MSSTVTTEAGEYLFDPVTFGEYTVSVGDPFDLGDSPPRVSAPPLSDSNIELTSDHPEAEVRFELFERVPCKKVK